MRMNARWNVLAPQPTFGARVAIASRGGARPRRSRAVLGPMQPTTRDGLCGPYGYYDCQNVNGIFTCGCFYDRRIVVQTPSAVPNPPPTLPPTRPARCTAEQLAQGCMNADKGCWCPDPDRALRRQARRARVGKKSCCGSCSEGGPCEGGCGDKCTKGCDAATRAGASVGRLWRRGVIQPGDNKVSRNVRQGIATARDVLNGDARRRKAARLPNPGASRAWMERSCSSSRPAPQVGGIKDWWCNTFPNSSACQPKIAAPICPPKQEPCGTFPSGKVRCCPTGAAPAPKPGLQLASFSSTRPRARAARGSTLRGILSGRLRRPAPKPQALEADWFDCAFTCDSTSNPQLCRQVVCDVKFP